MLDSIALHGPGHQIAVPPSVPAGAGDRRVKRVTVIGRTVTQLNCGEISVKRTVGFINHTSMQHIGPTFAAPSRPVGVSRIEILVVLDGRPRRGPRSRGRDDLMLVPVHFLRPSPNCSPKYWNALPLA